YIAMELVDGETLDELMQRGPVPSRKSCEVGAQIATGLAKTHDARIVHRDLKPQNVMINRDGLVKILDFGLGKTEAPLGEWDPEGPTWKPGAGRTLPGTVMGTPAYMSPQQAAGKVVD